DPNLARESATLGFESRSEVAGDALEGAILQQPREQQISSLQQGQVLRILHLSGWNEPGGLEVEKRSRNEHELAGLIQIPGTACRLDVGNELISHLRQRDLGDVHLVPRDQLKQQIERTIEGVQMHREGSAVRRQADAVGETGPLLCLVPHLEGHDAGSRRTSSAPAGVVSRTANI